MWRELREPSHEIDALDANGNAIVGPRKTFAQAA
jgi:hypothetical protein